MSIDDIHTVCELVEYWMPVSEKDRLFISREHSPSVLASKVRKRPRSQNQDPADTSLHISSGSPKRVL